MPNLSTLKKIAEHHVDAEASLRLFFSQNNPSYSSRFPAYTPAEVNQELIGRLYEADVRSALVVLARAEAAFRTDYMERGRSKLSDNVSIDFRRIYKARKKRARFENDILNTWSKHLSYPEKEHLGKLRGMFKFRHWIAHGRYWNHKPAHSFQDIYLQVDLILAALPLKS
ncbi:hypothetical protein [Pseudochelatococcus sp. G4_1912]|uniref:hypothetical protein n=1 Tax=Pseudochelatococcus sp. G4_1912 TaxID=3114288 RepID=UPI0039C60301